MLHLPILRWGVPYRSVNQVVTPHFRTRQPFVSMSQANLGLMSTIAGKDDYIILDADSHASIYDGCALGNAQIVRFRHNSVEDLDKRLGRLPKEGGRLVVGGKRHEDLFGRGRPAADPKPVVRRGRLAEEGLGRRDEEPLPLLKS